MTMPLDELPSSSGVGVGAGWPALTHAPRVDPHETPERTAPPRLARWYAQSPWAPALLRAAAAAGVLLVLAAVGAATLQGSAAHAAPAAAPPASEDGAWLAPPSPASATPLTSSAAPPPPASAAPPAPASARAPSRRCGRDAEGVRSPAVLPDGRLVLNLATEDDLRRLPGVGKRRAEQILALRGRLGRFRRVSELLRVRGIGARALQRLKPLVTLDAPPEPTGSAAAASIAPPARAAPP